jgi:hypothetical protein
MGRGKKKMAKVTDNNGKGENVGQTVNGQRGVEKNKAAESVYSIAELAGASRKRFDVMPETVTAALKTAGKAKATIAEAEAIIKNFKERKV